MFISVQSLRSRCGVVPLLASLLLTLPGVAAAEISLTTAVDAAWALHPSSRASASRALELDARKQAAQAWTAGPPSVGLAHRTDAWSNDAGLREYEAELAVPLWNPGMRRATTVQVQADTEAWVLQQRTERLAVAGQVREAAAQLALARVEHEAAQRKVQEAQALADDVDRRVKAGDVPRVDALQARSGAQLALGLWAQSQAALVRATTQWRALTGQTEEVRLEESPRMSATDGSSVAVQPEHPAWLAAQAQVRSAEARLAHAQADQRDPMELGVGVTRERSAAGERMESSVRIGLRIPLGSTSRNAPRLAAARADLDAAQAQWDAVARQIEAETTAAQAALEAARQQAAFAEQRAVLAAQVQALVAKSYRLGESDLPTRMRADNDKQDADLSLARARTELQHAVAQLNQSFGQLP